MGETHKRALVAIFVVLFLCLMAGTLFVAIELQHIGITAILVTVAAILLVDIRWVLGNASSERSS